MTDVLVEHPLLYSEPPMTCIGGTRTLVRKWELTAAQQVITNYFGMAVLPAGHRLVSVAVESDDLDAAGPSNTMSMGILNTYYNQAPATVAVPADYGPETGDTYTATNTGTAPALVSGQNIFTSSTVCQSASRVYPSLPFTDAIGVDWNRDRIIAFYFPIAPATAAAGTFTGIFGIEAAQRD